MKLAILTLVTFLFTGFASAHEMRPAIATAAIAEDGSYEVVISLNLESIMAGIEPEHTDTDKSSQALIYDDLRALPPENLRDKFAAFEPRFLHAVSFGSAGGMANPSKVNDVMIPDVGDLAEPRMSEIRLSGKLPPGTVDVVWSFSPEFGDSVIRLRRADDSNIFQSQFVSGPTSAPIPLDAKIQPGLVSTFIEYVELGFVHIVPRGLDHILFIVGLFLLSTRPSVLMWQVTAFTVAHTITFALGSLNVISISPAIVEPLIALSIVYVAVENLVTTRLTVWRPLIIFGFGLLHGLGFAGIMSEFGLSPERFLTGLVGFNIGVELGQLSVIATCFALVGWAMKFPSYRHLVVMPGSFLIALVAFYWSVERVLA